MKLVLIDDYSDQEIGVVEYPGSDTRVSAIRPWLRDIGYIYVRLEKGYEDEKAVRVHIKLEADREAGIARWIDMSAWRDEVESEIGPDSIQTEVKHLMPQRGYDRRGRPTVSGGPGIMLNHPIGASSEKTSLFTFTSKMNCPSFSLPAGPEEYGGTCAPSLESEISDQDIHRLHKPLEGRKPYQTFICDTCYAGKGNYIRFFTVNSSQTILKAWTEQALAEGRFVDEIVRAIRYLQEPDVAGAVREYLCDTRFFRIHDSGEFYSEEYYEAWREVCMSLKKTKFWAPTRMWVYPEWRDIFSRSKPPKNLSLRPSALFVDALPPRGLKTKLGTAEGSMSVPGDPTDPKVYMCPASYQGDPEWVDVGSCLHNYTGRKCRACWVRPDLKVNYWTH
jgi:hypothetical protein